MSCFQDVEQWCLQDSNQRALKAVILRLAPQETPAQPQMEVLLVVDQLFANMFKGSEVILDLKARSAASSVVKLKAVCPKQQTAKHLSKYQSRDSNVKARSLQWKFRRLPRFLHQLPQILEIVEVYLGTFTVAASDAAVAASVASIPTPKISCKCMAQKIKWEFWMITL
ncbi:hypothetical protein Pfo_021099 [Paulownia fortunei]|nr:hypothetical protein Pfo_021099 [Paulownia fortunei]